MKDVTHTLFRNSNQFFYNLKRKALKYNGSTWFLHAIKLMKVQKMNLQKEQRNHCTRYTTTTLKLFVFGDSYVDTGNYLNSPSYKPPYGMTFPGKPSGRFSDGRILTDYVGKFPISLA